MAEENPYLQNTPEDSAHEWSARQFQINQTLARVRTMVLVKVVAIQGGAGAVASPGTVTVQPLVKLIDGQGNASSHGNVNNIPVFRLGGGTNAVICDPVVGDIGWMAVADRDISAVKSNKAEAQPGSRRKFDLADGVYMGSLLSATPTQYITFTSTGMKLADANGIVIETKAGEVDITAPIVKCSGNLQAANLFLSGLIENVGGGTYTGNIHTTGTITADTNVVGGGKSLDSHEHSGVVVGGANTGPPV